MIFLLDMESLSYSYVFILLSWFWSCNFCSHIRAYNCSGNIVNKQTYDFGDTQW
jgi:hypothetical protein